MSKVQCHRCGALLNEGTLKYQVAVRVRSLFDGIIPESEKAHDEYELDRLLSHMSLYTEEQLTRQVYEDDVFIMCPECKEAFLEEIYSHLHAEATPEHGRAHLIH